MADPFVSEIRMFPYGFAPAGWAFCDGQLMPVSQNTALFSLLGTRHGGNGMSSYAIPDLKGRVPMHPGQGPGLSLRDLGEAGGSETVTLVESELPAHAHQLRASAQDASTTNGAGQMLANTRHAVYETSASPVAMHPSAVHPSGGGGQPHNNLQPYLVLNFCIALQGTVASKA